MKLSALLLVLLVGCGSVSSSDLEADGSGDAGTSGAAGDGQAGTTGSAGSGVAGTGAAGTGNAVTGEAGTTGGAGTSGSAGTSGAAGTRASGGAGTTGSAGNSGGAGTSGAAGTGAAGTSGQPVACLYVDSCGAKTICCRPKDPTLDGQICTNAPSECFRDPGTLSSYEVRCRTVADCPSALYPPSSGAIACEAFTMTGTQKFCKFYRKDGKL